MIDNKIKTPFGTVDTPFGNVDTEVFDATASTDAALARRAEELAELNHNPRRGPTVHWAEIGQAFGWQIVEPERNHYVTLSRGGNYELEIHNDGSAYAVRCDGDSSPVPRGPAAILTALKFLD